MSCSAYKGNYEDYLRQRAAEAEAKVEVKAEDEAPEYDRERAREERRQRKAAERLAEQAAAMEQTIHALEAQARSPQRPARGRQPGR